MIQKLKQYRRQLLTAGIIAGLMAITVSISLALLSKGFDMSRHANSQLVLGEWGWLQTINFLAYGILLIFAAIGTWYVTKNKPGGAWASILLGIYGIGSFIVGLAPTDPAFGFPLGSDATFKGYEAVSLSAQIHGVAGGIGFMAMAIACFFFARYFASLTQYAWVGISIFMGLLVFAVTAYLIVSAGAELSSFNYIPTWAVGSLLWLYVSLISWKLRSQDKA